MPGCTSADWFVARLNYQATSFVRHIHQCDGIFFFFLFFSARKKSLIRNYDSLRKSFFLQMHRFCSNNFTPRKMVVFNLFPVMWCIAWLMISQVLLVVPRSRWQKRIVLEILWEPRAICRISTKYSLICCWLLHNVSVNRECSQCWRTWKEIPTGGREKSSERESKFYFFIICFSHFFLPVRLTISKCRNPVHWPQSPEFIRQFNASMLSTSTFARENYQVATNSSDNLCLTFTCSTHARCLYSLLLKFDVRLSQRYRITNAEFPYG